MLSIIQWEDYSLGSTGVKFRGPKGQEARHLRKTREYTLLFDVYQEGNGTEGWERGGRALLYLA